MALGGRVALGRTVGAAVAVGAGDGVTVGSGVDAAGATLAKHARVATDDGSVGHFGPVTDLLLAELGADPHAEVYACGPSGMLEAVRAICAEHAIPAQLALESGMACGFGVCQACVVPSRHRPPAYRLLCMDGPVMDPLDVAW